VSLQDSVLSAAPSLRQQITESYIKHCVTGINYLNAEKELWFNHKGSAMRLTKVGFEFCSKELKLENYVTDLKTDSITAKNFLRLSRRLTVPYYIINGNAVKNSKIILFSEEDYTLLALLDGNLDRFLDLKID